MRKQIFMSLTEVFLKVRTSLYRKPCFLFFFLFRAGESLLYLTTLSVCRAAFRPSIFLILQSEWRDAGAGPSCLTTWMNLRFITGETQKKTIQQFSTRTNSNSEFQLYTQHCLFESMETVCSPWVRHDCKNTTLMEPHDYGSPWQLSTGSPGTKTKPLFFSFWTHFTAAVAKERRNAEKVSDRANAQVWMLVVSYFPQATQGLLNRTCCRPG